MNDHRDDGRSRDQSDLSHTEQNRNEQQRISHQEPELLEGPVSKEAEKETAAGAEFEKTAAVKKEKKRRAAWLSPILGGIIGGGRPNFFAARPP